MTLEEAIKILTAKAECMRRETSGIDIDCNYRNCDECDLCYKQGTTGDQMEALRVAISALQTHDVNDMNVGDTVRRQAAIDALCRRCDLAAEDDDPCTEKCNDIKILEKLPSAQSEPREDAVSRRRLLNDLKELITAWKKYPIMEEQIKGIGTAIGYVMAIPPVTPKRKTGKWIHSDFSHEFLHCSECGRGRYFCSNFCPNCGADMRSETE